MKSRVEIKVIKTEFMEYIKTILGFVGSGSYGIEGDTIVLNMNPKYISMLKGIISHCLKGDGYNPRSIYRFVTK